MNQPALTWTDTCATDPEPEGGDDGAWWYYPDLGGQGADPWRLATMTTIQLASREYL